MYIEIMFANRNNHLLKKILRGGGIETPLAEIPSLVKTLPFSMDLTPEKSRDLTPEKSRDLIPEKSRDLTPKPSFDLSPEPIPIDPYDMPSSTDYPDTKYLYKNITSNKNVSKINVCAFNKGEFIKYIVEEEDGCAKFPSFVFENTQRGGFLDGDSEPTDLDNLFKQKVEEFVKTFFSQTGGDGDAPKRRVLQTSPSENAIVKEDLEQEKEGPEQTSQEEGPEQTSREKENLDKEGLEQPPQEEGPEQTSQEKEGLEQTFQEKEGLEQTYSEQENLDKEGLKQTPQEEEGLERTPQEKEGLEQPYSEQENLDKEETYREDIDKEDIDKENLDKEGLKQPYSEQENLDKEDTSREDIDKEDIDKEDIEQTSREQEGVKQPSQEILDKEILVPATYIGYIMVNGEPYVFVNVSGGKLAQQFREAVLNELFYIFKVDNLDVDKSVKDLFDNNRWLLNESEPYSGYMCKMDEAGQLVNIKEDDEEDMTNIESIGDFYYFSFQPIDTETTHKKFVIFPNEYVCILDDSQMTQYKANKMAFAEEKTIYFKGEALETKRNGIEFMCVRTPSNFAQF